MKSFIFGIILITSFSSFAQEGAAASATAASTSDPEAAPAAPELENVPTSCQSGEAIRSDAQACSNFSNIKCESSGSDAMISFDGTSIQNNGSVSCEGDALESIGSRGGIGRHDICKFYVENKTGQENFCTRQIMRISQGLTVVQDTDDLANISTYGGAPTFDGNPIDCASILVEGSDSTARYSGEIQGGNNTTTEFKLFQAKDEVLLTFQGCKQVFGNQVFSERDLATLLEDTVDAKKKLCLAYVQASSYGSSSGTCLDQLNECADGREGSSTACSTLKNQLTNGCGESPQPIQKSLGTMITGCTALRKAKKNISGLDTETDGQQENYVTVDYEQGQNGQGQNSRGGFTCRKGPGKMALDYQSCKRAAHAFNAGFVFGDVVGEVGIAGYGAVQGVADQGAAAQTAASGEPGAGQSAEFEAARRSHILQRNQNYARAGIQGAKGASMIGFMMNYVTAKKVKNDWCMGNGQQEGTDVRLSQAESCSLIYMMKNSGDNPANNVTDGDQGRHEMISALFPNAHVTGMLGQNAAASLAQALVAGVMGVLHDKQAKMVGQVKEEFEAANFNQPDTGIAMDDLPTFCSENPTAPSCQAFDPNLGTGGSGFNIDFGSGINSSPNEIAFENGEGLTESEQQALAEVTTEPVGEIPGLVGGDSSGQGDSDLTAIAPGNVSSSQRSGGGSGGGAAGGGGGGGAGPDPSKPGSGPQDALGKKIAGKYSSGTAGRFSSGGSAKKKANTNPFNNLTGKSSNRSVASEVEKKLLPKNIKLFSAISKRYSEVNRSGRLENK